MIQWRSSKPINIKGPEGNNKRIIQTLQTTNDETGIRDTY